MTTQEIKTAIDDGQKVFWKNLAYEVIKDRKEQYLILCHLNQYCIGLTSRDGTNLNGQEQDFFIQ